MPSNRRINLQIAYNPAAKVQSAWGTALDNSDLTAVLNCTSPNHVDTVEKVEELFDCTGQYKVGEQVLTQLGRLIIDFEVEIVALGAFLALQLGVAAAPTGTNPYTHALSPLGVSSFQPPFTTFIVGFNDGSDDGVVFKNATFNTLSLAAKGTDRVTGRAEILGDGTLPAASGFTFPACAQYTPLRLTDGTFTLDGENLLSGTDPNHTARSFEISLSNNLLANDDPFPLAQVNPVRLERANVRAWLLKMAVEGRINDTLHTKAKNRSVVASSLRIGSSTSGATLSIPYGILKRDTPQQGFEGEAERATLNLIHEPKKIPGNAATPLTYSVVNAQSGQYLQS